MNRRAGHGEACRLSSHVATNEGQRGHTVLCYEDSGRTRVYDPADGHTTAVHGLVTAPEGDEPGPRRSA